MSAHHVFMPLVSTLKNALIRTISQRRFSPVQTLALSFVLVILIGAGLLSLPVSQRPGVQVSLLDALFTATSATCVTGLVIVDTVETWTHFGQIIILLMIQIGGLGYMTFATIFALLLGARIGLRARLQLKEAHGVFTLRDTIRVVRFVGIGTLLIEGIGAILLTLRFHFQHHMAWDRAAFEGLFYSISAFCNAGFDLVTKFQGLTLPPYQRDPWLLIILGILIIMGGLGFGVLAEFAFFPRARRFSLHAKLVFTTSGVLILVGMLGFLLFEGNNPMTLGALDTPFQKGVMAWFMGVTPRTAGFSPVDLSAVSPPTLAMIGSLMIIGASPYSTGGGVKTTTVAVILLVIIALVRRRPDVEAFGRRIGGDVGRLALSLVSVYMVAVLLVIISMSITEITWPGLPPNNRTMTFFGQLNFEVLSAFSTVGLSTGITASLKPFSQLLIMLSMYLGRLGPLAFIFVFAQPARCPTSRRLPSEQIMVG